MKETSKTALAYLPKLGKLWLVESHLSEFQKDLQIAFLEAAKLRATCFYPLQASIIRMACVPGEVKLIFLIVGL